MNENRIKVLETALTQVEQLEVKWTELNRLESQANVEREGLNRIEAAIYSQVCQENNKDGKPIFSNDGARKAETQARINLSDAYLAKHQLFDSVIYKVEMLKVSLRAVEMQISLRKAYLHGGEYRINHLS